MELVYRAMNTRLFLYIDLYTLTHLPPSILLSLPVPPPIFPSLCASINHLQSSGIPRALVEVTIALCASGPNPGVSELWLKWARDYTAESHAPISGQGAGEAAAATLDTFSVPASAGFNDMEGYEPDTAAGQGEEDGGVGFEGAVERREDGVRSSRAELTAVRREGLLSGKTAAVRDAMSGTASEIAYILPLQQLDQLVSITLHVFVVIPSLFTIPL